MFSFFKQKVPRIGTTKIFLTNKGDLKKMRNTKLMAAIPMVATLIAPMTAFAATSYKTTNASVTNANAITADAPTNEVSVSVTQGSTFSVTIPKTIVLNGTAGAANEAQYDVKVSGNIASNETINVVPVTSFKMSDVKGVKKQLDATVTQTYTKFVDSQVSISSSVKDTMAIGDTTGKVSVADLTSGSWTGNFNFAISLTAA
jgi:hypothetical protein